MTGRRPHGARPETGHAGLWRQAPGEDPGVSSPLGQAAACPALGMSTCRSPVVYSKCRKLIKLFKNTQARPVRFRDSCRVRETALTSEEQADQRSAT